jgi:peptide/nickel transport system substrate-binding protein
MCGVFLFISVLCSNCAPPTRSEGAARSVLTIGLPEGLVAGADLGPQNLVAFLTVEGLTQLSADGRAIPRLAQSWSWERDGLSLRIVLRPDVTLHDGTRLTAQLAADLVREAVARPSNRLLYTSISDISSIRPEGEQQIVVHLAQRSAFLPEDLELPLAVGPDRIGTGPYRVVKRGPSEIVMQRFAQYYDGIPQIEQVIVKPFGTLRTAWASLLRGEVDMVTNVSPDAIQFIQNEEVEVISFRRRYQYLVAFNSRRPPFASSVVRRALNYAVDRDALVKTVLQGRGSPSTGPLWPKHWAYDTSIAPYGFNPGLAVSLLNDAGLPADTRHAGRPRSRLRFTCLIPADFSLFERVGLTVQKQLYSIGVDMQFDVVPIDEFNARVRDGRFEAMLIDMVGGPSFGRAYNLWGSARHVKGLNVFGYENAEAERLFGILRTSTNEAAIRSATSNLQRVLLEDPPALFLTWDERSRAVRRDFQVIRDPDRDPVSTIYRWSVANRPAHSP